MLKAALRMQGGFLLVYSSNGLTFKLFKYTNIKSNTDFSLTFYRPYVKRKM